MREAGRDRQYERLYTQLLARAEQLHQSNKRRIRRGLIGLIVLPFILCFILWVTGSSKIVFLIVWVIIMFVMSAYLITIEYIDDFVQKTLNEMSEKETDFGDLLDREPLQDRIAGRLSGIRSIREDLRADIRARLAGSSEDNEEDPSNRNEATQGNQAGFYIDTVNTKEKNSDKDVRNNDADSDTAQGTEDGKVSASEQTGGESTNSGFDEDALLAALAGGRESVAVAVASGSDSNPATELQAAEDTSDAQEDSNEGSDLNDHEDQSEEAGV